MEDQRQSVSQGTIQILAENAQQAWIVKEVSYVILLITDARYVSATYSARIQPSQSARPRLANVSAVCRHRIVLQRLVVRFVTRQLTLVYLVYKIHSVLKAIFALETNVSLAAVLRNLAILCHLCLFATLQATNASNVCYRQIAAEQTKSVIKAIAYNALLILNVQTLLSLFAMRRNAWQCVLRNAMIQLCLMFDSLGI